MHVTLFLGFCWRIKVATWGISNLLLKNLIQYQLGNDMDIFCKKNKIFDWKMFVYPGKSIVCSLFVDFSFASPFLFYSTLN